MTFVPTAEKLIPDLTRAEELVLLARCLWDDGYDDHLAGHITFREPDGTFLCNPWLLTWGEILPHQVIRIDGDGRVLEGDWPVPAGIPLHLEIHKRRHVNVVVHHHPRYGTLWANAGKVPPCLDQSSALGGGSITVVDEYVGGVGTSAIAADVAEAIGDADMALLRHHGVVVTGDTVRAAHQRAVALEQRARHALLVQNIGGAPQLPDVVMDRVAGWTGNEFFGFWEAMVRAQLRKAPEILDRPK